MQDKTTKISNLIYGKSEKSGITSIDIDDTIATLYFQDGKTETLKHEPFLLWSRKLHSSYGELRGDQHYKYFKKYHSKSAYIKDLKWARANNHDFLAIWNPVEQLMVKNGITYYKDMKISDISILSFDIETTTLNHNNDAMILLITNTFRDKKGNIKRRLFSYDDYETQVDLINDWADFVNSVDPDVITGHNILGFDFPYIEYIYGGGLYIGKNGRASKTSRGTREFRKDGSQTITYQNIDIPGREIIDTFFLSIKYDNGRKYPSYRLKEIVKYENLEKEDRQHYNAGSIRENYRIPEEWEKIKNYAIHDADDSLAIFDLMAPSFFYYAQSISKTFQEVILGASGSQINNMMIRSYLQNGHSIPKADKPYHFEGGISRGNPGIYDWVYKVDVASLYPSIMLEYGIHNKTKDPSNYMLKILQYFTKERLKNKELGKTSQYHNDLQSAQKIIINSFYGLLGTPGLNYNSPEDAESITRHGREILMRGVDWAERLDFNIVNMDTDSFSFTSGREITKEDYSRLREDLNSQFPDKIVWEDDGIYPRFIVVKAKNYVLFDGEKIKTKGSGLKATMKEPALRKMINEIIEDLVYYSGESCIDIYTKYVKYANSVTSNEIQDWCSKKTITKAVLNPQRTNEDKILEACKHKINAGELGEGDKIWVFFDENENLKLSEDFSGSYSNKKLLEKTFKTIKIFDNIINIKDYPNYSLKKNAKKLEDLNEQKTYELPGMGKAV